MLCNLFHRHPTTRAKPWTASEEVQIAPRSRDGSVEIVATLGGEALQLEVRDVGPGAASDIMTAAAGVGLCAVRQRLETPFPGRSEFSVVTAPSQGFIARVALPADTSHYAVPAGLA